MKIKEKKLILLMAVLVVLLGSSCAWFEGGVRRQRAEPEVSLFLTEEDRTVSLKFEEYIEGVVAAEMSADWPVQALAAQAILARTYAWRKLQDGGEQDRYGTDVSDDTTSFQAYSAERITDSVREAVEMTRGRVIIHDGQPALTWFHASSGGMTATAEEGLGFTDEPTPHIKSVEEPEGADLREWSETITEAQIINALQEMGYEASSVQSFTVAERGPSGRAVQLQIGDQTVPAPSFRISVDPDIMRSTFLDSIEVQGGSVSMSGKGYGHGVGLSQEGAKALAEEGASYEEIIDHYYEGVRLMQIWR